MRLRHRALATTAATAACFAALNAAAVLLAQELSPQPPVQTASQGGALEKIAPEKIEGFVLDGETRQPLAGATVRVNANLSVSTDQSGHFAFERPAQAPGNVVAEAPGYQASSVPLAQGQGMLEITLIKAAEIRGVLVDAETRYPLAGVPLAAEPVALAGLLVGQPNRLTGADGSFRIEGLKGNVAYSLSIQAGAKPSIVKISAEEAKSDKAQEQRDASEKQGFGLVYWPGGGSGAPTSGILPGSGGIADVGEIRLRTERLRKLAGSVDADCEDGDVVELALGRGPGRSRNDRYVSGEIACGEGFEVQNLPDGNFFLYAMVIGHGARQIASQEIDSRTRGPLVLRLVKSVPLNGVIELEGVSSDDFPVPLGNLQVSLVVQSPVGPESKIQQLGPDRFESAIYPGETYRLAVSMPRRMGDYFDGYYVKRVMHDGAPVQDNRFSAFGGDLHIVISNRPAALQVQVQSGDKPQPGGMVGIAKEGRELDISALRTARTDQDGRAVFRGLEPGQYRAIALAQTNAGVDEIARLLLSSGTPVTLEEGRTGTLSLSVK